MESYYRWHNRSKGTIKILKDKDKSTRVWRRVPKRIQDFGLFWEAEIYSCMDEKDGRTPMERLIGDTIDIPEWTESEF